MLCPDRKSADAPAGATESGSWSTGGVWLVLWHSSAATGARNILRRAASLEVLSSQTAGSQRARGCGGQEKLTSAPLRQFHCPL